MEWVVEVQVSQVPYAQGSFSLFSTRVYEKSATCCAYINPCADFKKARNFSWMNDFCPRKFTPRESQEHTSTRKTLATHRRSRSWMRWGSLGGPGWQAMTQPQGPYWAINSCSCATPKTYPAPMRGFSSHSLFSVQNTGLRTALQRSSLDSSSFRSGKRDVSSHSGRPEFNEEPTWQPEKWFFLPRCFLHLDVSPNILFDQWKVGLFQFVSVFN